MKTFWPYVLSAGLVLAGGAAEAQDKPVYTINPVSGLSIDGDLSDWTGAEFETYSASTVADTGGSDFGTTPDAVCTFAMMYNNENLYLACEVEDDIISFVDTTTLHAWWERDGVQWFIDFTNNPEQEIILYPDFFFDFENVGGASKWLPGETIIAIGATEDQTVPMTRQWPVGTRDGDRSDWNDFTLDDGSVVRGEVNEAWESVVVIDESASPAKYTIEVRVPWSSLEESKYYSDPEDPTSLLPEDLDQLGWEPLLPEPLAGSTIGFTHLCIDCDLAAGGFDSQVMWVGDGDNDTTWGQATFAESSPVRYWELH